jgi:hypothetical protein
MRSFKKRGFNGCVDLLLFDNVTANGLSFLSLVKRRSVLRNAIVSPPRVLPFSGTHVRADMGDARESWAERRDRRNANIEEHVRRRGKDRLQSSWLHLGIVETVPR